MKKLVRRSRHVLPGLILSTAAWSLSSVALRADDAPAPSAAATTWLASQPRDAFDVDALSAKLTTPEAAFAYVRDEIAYEPYTGVMKGAAGALLTHGANDYDRALLLAKLLEVQGIEAKVVRGTLSAAAAQALVDQVPSRPAAVERLLASLPATAAIAEPDAFEAKAQRQLFDQRSADRSRMIADAEAAQRPLVAAAVPASGRKPLVAPTEHVWVQATIHDKLVNLDPSRATSKIGDTPTQVVDEWAAGSLPDEVFHTLKVSLISETLKDGQLERHELLTRDLVAASTLLQGVRIAVVQAPTDKGPGSYLPMILTGADETDGTVFKLSGSVPKPKDSGMVGMLGGFGGGAPAETTPEVDDPTGPKLARLWVEVTFHAPGLPDETARRVMLDRVEAQGDKWKFVSALADDEAVRGLLVQAWDAALDVGAPHPIAIMDVEAGAFAALKPATQALGEKRALSASDLPALPPAFQLWNFFLTSGLKHQAIAAAEAKPARSIHVRPRLAFIRHGFNLADWTKPGQKKLRYEEGIDLVNAPFAFLGDAAAAKDLALRAGLTDTAFEQYAINAKSSLNTFPLMAAAQTQKVPLVTITDAKQIDALKIAPAIRAVLAGEVADGRVLLLPNRPVELQGTHVVGWWSIDPATGYAIGKMELGGAQAMVEKGQTEEKVSEWTQTYVKIMGDALKCFEGEVTKAFKQDVKAAILGGDAAQTPGADTMASCLRDAACDALKDMATGRISNAVAERESKMLKDLLFNWLRGQAIDQAGKAESAGCQALLGGG
jgi:hypothetical protein